MLSEPGGPFINVDKLDLRKYAARPMLARALCDYIIYNEHNMKKALELCAMATQGNNFNVRGREQGGGREQEEGSKGGKRKRGREQGGERGREGGRK